jgi:hypothetical protein
VNPTAATISAGIATNSLRHRGGTAARKTSTSAPYTTNEPRACPLGKLLPGADATGTSTTGRIRPTSVFTDGSSSSAPTPVTIR